MRQFVVITLLCGVLLPASACRTTGTYRVVDLPEGPEAAEGRVEAELRRRGYQVHGRRVAGRTVTLTAGRARPRPAPRPAPPPRAAPPRRKSVGAPLPVAPPPPPKKAVVPSPRASPPPRKQAVAPSPVAVPAPRKQAAADPPLAPPSRPKDTLLTARLHPHQTGTRVLLHGEDRASLGPVFAKEKHRDLKVGFGLNGPRLLWELHGAVGYRYAPRFGNDMAIEAGARLGYRALQLGGGDDWPEPQVSVGLAAGLGGGWAVRDDSGYAMPSVTLSLLIRRTLEPLPGQVIPQGPEFAVDLHAVGLLGTGRRALEGQLVFRYGDYLGFYVGAGYQWLPARGPTFTAGLYLSTIGVAAAALIAAIAASN